MRMLSGRMHWLTVGLALLVSAHGFATKRLHGQAIPPGMASQMPNGMPPGMMGGIQPAGGMMSPDRPMSFAFKGPPPMEVAYANGGGPSGYPGGMGACDGTSCGGNGCGLSGCGYGGTMAGGDGSGLLGRLDSAGCGYCGGGMCGGRGCGIGSGIGGRIASGNGPLARMRGGCVQCGGAGCGVCGGANGCLFSGALLGLLGPLAPYSEDGGASQRWFDIYAGTIGLSRTSDFGGFVSPERDPVTGAFLRTYDVSSFGIGGPIALQTSDLDLDKMRYGLELMAALQLGPGSSLEARYFGLNNWDVSKQAEIIWPAPPTLYSIYSLFGTAPAGGFQDTDESFIHNISYSSELHNGEVNYRRRFNSPFAAGQGSWLAGIRYFDLDERFRFSATNSIDGTFAFDKLRFFDHQTQTRNQLTGFQIGGDYWLSVVPGLQVGVESKGGIFGNHAEVETQIFSNSIPGAVEHLQDGQAAYLGELVISAVYRLSYSWSVKTSYNLLYVDNVALAPENHNTRDINNAIGGGAFTLDRHPFIDTDGEVTYQGWSIGGEYLW